jgi:hypothetical protein
MHGGQLAGGVIRVVCGWTVASGPTLLDAAELAVQAPHVYSI